MMGYAMCGSFCTLGQAMEQMEALKKAGYDIQPIMSEIVYRTDTRFGKAEEWVKQAEALCRHPVIHSIVEAEPLGPKKPLDALIISPCTGNTLAKLACGITDTAVCMAAKAHLRADRPLVVALASNDAQSANLKNVAVLLNRKNVYFVPLVQDDPTGKPHSMVADFTKIPATLEDALQGRQIRKLLW